MASKQQLDACLDAVRDLDLRMSSLEGRADAANAYPLKLEIELTQWESLPQLLAFLRYVKASANAGHSFKLEADREEGDSTSWKGYKMNGRPVWTDGGCPKVFVDGDGNDHIGRIWLNGEEVK